ARAEGRKVRRCLAAAVGSELPGGAVSSQRFLLEARDIAVLQASEVVVILVVFADVVEAEEEIFTFTIASHRRAMRSRPVATVPLAASLQRLGFRVIRSDADFLEVFRVKFHALPESSKNELYVTADRGSQTRIDIFHHRCSAGTAAR